MLDRLHSEQLILHEKYGGITLTASGENMARALGERHALLVAFLKLFGVEETTAQKDTEGLEHYIDSRTLDLLARFVKYVSLNPQLWSQFRKQART
jgi:Mn-dependent DtxR family transcriptional regulator